MEAFVERMFAEQKQLCERVEKLESFVYRNPKFKELSEEDQYDLKMQLQVMTMYSDILQRRLDRVTKSEEG